MAVKLTSALRAELNAHHKRLTKSPICINASHTCTIYFCLPAQDVQTSDRTRLRHHLAWQLTKVTNVEAIYSEPQYD